VYIAVAVGIVDTTFVWQLCIQRLYDYFNLFSKSFSQQVSFYFLSVPGELFSVIFFFVCFNIMMIVIVTITCLLFFVICFRVCVFEHKYQERKIDGNKYAFVGKGAYLRAQR